MRLHTWLVLLGCMALCVSGMAAGERAAALRVSDPMRPPGWAVLQRELLRANEAACREFYARYFDRRGYLQCVLRWGGDDGPDDAIECFDNWPILHALGASDEVLRLYKQGWEGHLRQYTEAKTVEVPLAREGMYYQEFPVMFDWLHNGEGLTAFNVQGLSDPRDRNFQRRVRRFAGFYMNEDPEAPNYDPKHRIIRSLFNGSRGPLLRNTTALDWAGDPIEIGARFKPKHGERSFEEMLAHFKDYNDIVGDHPSNLSATTLALNAYMLTQEEKYRRWLLEYVDAWRERIIANGGLLPSKIGLDGRIGGPSGKWYSGVYGWGFIVVVPQTGALAHRNTTNLGLIGFGNAYLLTGDDRYLDGWRTMIDKINSQARIIDGSKMYPQMHGDNGWYHFTSEPYAVGADRLWYWSMKAGDRRRLPTTGWVAFLEGANPDYPEQSLRADLERVRRCVAGLRADTTTPDTRLADDPLAFNPASVDSLVQQMLGGLPQRRQGTVLHSRLRYFDPRKRRAGMPDDVAALVEKLTSDQAVVTLVNLHRTEPRTVVVQAGGYGEHEFTQVECAGKITRVDAPLLTVRLDPRAGARLALGMRRYVHPPTLTHPRQRAGS